MNEYYTSVTAPGINNIDPHSLIWPDEHKDKALFGSGVDSLSVWVHRLGASDLHLQANQPAKANIHGRLWPVMTRPLSYRDVESAAIHIYGVGAPGWLSDGNDFRVGHTVHVKAAGDRWIVGKHRVLPDSQDERYRFRWHGNSERQWDSDAPQMTARVVERVPPTLASLGVEEEIISHVRPKRGGLVLVVGQPSQGKTRLLAGICRSYLDDEDFCGKIIELADPQEYVFDGLMRSHNIYSVSEIGPGSNYKSASDALLGALSRAPNVIIAPEMISPESIRLCLSSARMGVATYATMHATNVANAIRRAIATFPFEEQERNAFDLLDNLRLIIHCQLVRAADGRRVQLREFLPFTPLIRRQIAQERYEVWGHTIERLVHTVGQSASKAAIIAMDQGKITQEEAQSLEEDMV